MASCNTVTLQMTEMSLQMTELLRYKCYCYATNVTVTLQMLLLRYKCYCYATNYRNVSGKEKQFILWMWIS